MNDHPLNASETDGHALDERLEEQLTDDAPASRRHALRTLGKLGLGAAALSLATFGPRPRKALAQAAPGAGAILNFALTLEYLEMFFYQQGTDSGVVPGGAMEIFELIQAHEEAHVAFLTDQIETNTDADPVEFTQGDFDFTAGGNFDPFGDYGQFLTLSQGFEDTGVRAYKGQAANVQGTPYLNAALQIHALEARHAAEVRRLRAASGVGVQPWIVLDSGTDGGPLEAVYAGDDTFPPEENTTQAGVDLTTLGNGYSAEDASAAFDEPLTMDAVNAIAGQFFAMSTEVTLDFSSDVGVLNYAYALEQLEAAFYAMAADNLDSYSSGAQSVLSDLAAHEEIHRQTLMTALGDGAIPGLTPDFSSIDFSDEQSVLANAQVFEDLGVSAYNGAGSLLTSADFVAAAGSIVSVEARHAAAIRDLMDPTDDYFGGEFALDGEYVIDENGLDEARSPDEIIPQANNFIQETLVAQNL